MIILSKSKCLKRPDPDPKINILGSPLPPSLKNIIILASIDKKKKNYILQKKDIYY